VLGWSVTAVAGDPTLLLVPFLAVVALLLAAVALGAPARAEVVVPILSPPPADSFQDIGVLNAAGIGGTAEWIARALFGLGRTVVFATLAGLAVRRAGGTVRPRRHVVALLGSASFGWALWVSQQSSLDPARDSTVAATALAFGMLFLPGAYVAAAEGAGVVRAIGRGFGAGRPLGHIVLVLAYGAALNGLYRLASFGEPAGGRALPLTLYAFAAAFLTMVFVSALARRAALRHNAIAPNHP
ncbi:MAG: hypothetical protein ACREE7_05090, partial [Dongiaceae bacterium]